MQLGELTSIKGIGEKNKLLFKTAGIKNIYDLLHYFPRDYHDYSKVSQINSAVPGQVTLRVDISKVSSRYVRRGMHITEATATDKTGSIKLIWFNQPYRKDSIKSSDEYFVTGKLEYSSGRYSIISPNIELATGTTIHTARIVPIYRETKGLNNHLIRKSLADAIKQSVRLPNILPSEILKKNKLMTYSDAIKNLHFPKDNKQLQQAKYTMSFIEVFELMLASNIIRSELSGQIAPQISFNQAIAQDFVASLPYELTDAQRKVMWQILQDIDNEKPMNRLVEGDVGSGKTVIASMAIAMALKSDYQVAYLAPTEILARQHFQTITELLEKLQTINFTPQLLIGSMKKSEKLLAYKKIESGETNLLIGTHALLQGLNISNLGLIIIDEQHRFGVDQRNELMKHNKLVPHILSMTATPIPRSLALTLYGELDVSLLDAMPPGRKTIRTSLVLPTDRDELEKHIDMEITSGRQVYVVCPLIDEASKIDSTSVETVYKRLSQKIFKHRSVGLLHGKLKPVEKNQMMQDFVNGKIDILVSTTVIEVGVNVPNASIMVIEGAERFGLAQMHQLRGRVGRSDNQAYCYLIPSENKSPTKRLRAFCRINDGFKLAELDLELRGPGAIYGKLQHGALDFRFASLSDHKLLRDTRLAVNEFAQYYSLNDYPELKRRVRLAQAIITLN